MYVGVAKLNLMKYHIFLFLLLLSAFPFILFPDGTKSLVLLLLPFIMLLRWYKVKHFVLRTPLDWSIFLMMFMVLVSIWATPDLSFSLGKVAGVLFGIVFYYVMVDLIDSDTSLQSVVVFFSLFGVGFAVLAILGMQATSKFSILGTIPNQIPHIFRGISGAENGFNPNQVGGVLLFFVPLQGLLFQYYVQRKLHQNNKTALYGQRAPTVLCLVLLGIAMLVSLGSLLISQSRGALGGLLVAIFFLIALRTRWGKVAGLLFVIAIVLLIRFGFADQLVSPQGANTEVVGTVHLAGRMEIWSRALYGLADFPFTGMGMNMFRRVMPVLYPTFIVPNNRDMAHAHNHLLQAGLDLGIPGLIAYLSLWLVVGYLLYYVTRHSKDVRRRVIATGLSGGLLAHFVYGMTDTVALGSKPGFVFWWVLAISVAVFRLEMLDVNHLSSS